jgi:hypothetical protein
MRQKSKKKNESGVAPLGLDLLGRDKVDAALGPPLVFVKNRACDASPLLESRVKVVVKHARKGGEIKARGNRHCFGSTTNEASRRFLVN